VPLLHSLSDDEFRPLAEQVQVRTYPPGTTIVAQGEAGQTLYIILAGRVGVLHHARDRTATALLAELGPGDFFGEMALLEQRPRSADVVATTATTCGLLDSAVFREHVLGKPQIVAALLAALSQRLRAVADLVERPRHQTSASPRERTRRVLEQGETAMANDIRDALVIKEQNHFTLFNPDGNIPIANTAGLGMYLGDTRHLSGYEVSLGRVQPVPLVSTARQGYASVQEQTNRDIRLGGRTIHKQTLLISRERLAHAAGFEERITIANFNRSPVDIAIEVRFAADFADIFAVRGVGHARRGAHAPAAVDDDAVTLRYHGTDDRLYETRLAFDPPPTRLRGRSATYRVRVEGLGRYSLRAQVTAGVRATDDESRSSGIDAPTPPAQRLADLVRSYQESTDAATAALSDNELFDAAMDRSLADLRLLVSELHGQRYLAAGIPWFATLFGRDSLITGLQLLAWNPDLAAGILRLLARYQGTRDDPWRDEEPGKILHELRTGELALTHHIPHTPYYGTVDATPLFVMLAAAYHEWTGDDGLLREIGPNLEAALRWCLEFGDTDGDGYVEYARRSGKGLANQGWRDSGVGIMFRDGRLPKPPLALVEVQAYLYAAYRGMARMLRVLQPGEEVRPRELEERADRLRERFNRDFWMPDVGFYALGLDGKKQRIDALTSNPGHALWTGIVDPARAGPVGTRLLSAELFSGWGIRTLSTQSATYNPLGYHLGTVWPHDNALILAGLRRYGLDAEANQVFDAQFDAALHFPDFRLPELFSGIARTSYGVPIGYPIACSPQAWSAGALPFMLSQVLGLRPRAGRVLEIVRPSLPAALQQVQLRGLRVGAARVDLTFTRATRSAGPAGVVVDRCGGDVEVQGEGVMAPV
jgi:glycogen debranching enzyme